MDNKFIDSIYNVIKDNPKVALKNVKEVKNTLLSISMRLLQDMHQVDTMTVLSVYCAMLGIKNDFKLDKVYCKTRETTED